MPDEVTRTGAEGPPPWFALLNEIGIIAQLSRTLLEARLPGGLILPHFSVLNHLIRVGDGPTPLALARAFQVPKATMTHTLGGLVRHSYVDLRPNPRDGRSKQVWLTQAGRAFRDDAVAAMTPDIGALSRVMGSAEVAALLDPIRRIRIGLDAMRSGEGD